MKKRIVIICIAALVLISIIVFIVYKLPVSFGGQSIQIYESLDSDDILSYGEVLADREQLIELVESVHPVFIDGTDLSKYEQAKRRFIDATETDMSVSEFRYEVGCYLAVFQDGHTRLWWSDEKSFEIWHKYINNQMYYYRYEGGETIPTDLYITAINGVPIENIYEVIDSSVSAENEYAKAVNYSNYITSESILKLAGVEIIGDSVTVSLNDGSTVICPYYIPSENSSSDDGSGNRWAWDGDIFVVTFESCTKNPGFIDTVDELKKAVKKGCNKIIIDVRNNGGGDSNTCTELLEAMGMKAPKYGMIIRYSKEAKRQFGYIRSSGTYISEELSNGKNNSNIDLVVLYNRNTFSSANMMCVYVRDGNLGTLIGEPCGNSPSHYGQPIYFSLENSHLYGSISHKAFTRPNGDWKEKVLWPDVETVNDDPYQTAIDFLNSH